MLATGRDPRTSQIRLAWWREALERLDTALPPAEPLLEALAAQVLPLGVSGTELATLEEGWALLLTPGPLSPDLLTDYAQARGALLFRLSARLLGEEAVGAAGARWALVDLARHSSDPAEASAAMTAARASPRAPVPKRLRPLALLALLADRDLMRGAGALERQGAPARVLRLLIYRLFGS